MALSHDQKQWLVGGGIGAIALAIGYGLLRRTPTRTPPYQVRPPLHHHRHQAHDQMNEGRGEYGHHRRHRGHHHDE
jgi:hypothetical protein